MTSTRNDIELNSKEYLVLQKGTSIYVQLISNTNIHYIVLTSVKDIWFACPTGRSQ